MPTAPSHLPRRLVGFSTKCYFDLPTTTSYLTHLLSLLPKDYPSPDLGLFLIPSFPTLPAAAAALNPSNPSGQSSPFSSRRHRILLGAQNCHSEDTGAFTGEVSPIILKQVGCDLVEIGHAERRRPPLNESDEQVAAKARAVVRNGMVPLVCIGEKERPLASHMKQAGFESEDTFVKGMSEAGIKIAAGECQAQITAVMEAIPDDAAIIFAYEPVWAIGAKEPADAGHVCGVVRELKAFADGFGQTGDGKVERSRSGDVRWLYGGSAGPGVWEGLKGELDGLFLGRFAHDVKRFIGTVEEVSEGRAS